MATVDGDVSSQRTKLISYVDEGAVTLSFEFNEVDEFMEVLAYLISYMATSCRFNHVIVDLHFPIVYLITTSCGSSPPIVDLHLPIMDLFVEEWFIWEQKFQEKGCRDQICAPHLQICYFGLDLEENHVERIPQIPNLNPLIIDMYNSLRIPSPIMPWKMASKVKGDLEGCKRDLPMEDFIQIFVESLNGKEIPMKVWVGH